MTQDWYVARKGKGEGKRYGPVPLNQLRDLVDSGKVRPDDLVWNEGMTNWQRADQCAELFPPSAPQPAYERESPRYGPDDRDPPYRRGGYSPYDDRPYRRYPSPYYRPPVQSSNAWIIPVAVVGGLVALGFLGCGGAAMVGMMNARSSSSSYSPSSPGYGGGYSGVDPGPDEEGAAPWPGGGPVTKGPALTQHFYGNGRLDCSSDIDDGTANLVGNHLRDNGWFDDGKTVRLKLVNGAYQVYFQVADAWGQSSDAYVQLRSDLAAKALPGCSVNVCLCDSTWTLQRTITSQG
jgi:hypothetical protein